MDPVDTRLSMLRMLQGELALRVHHPGQVRGPAPPIAVIAPLTLFAGVWLAVTMAIITASIACDWLMYRGLWPVQEVGW